MKLDRWIEWFVTLLSVSFVLFLWLVFGLLQKILIVGAAVGGSIGCVISLYYMFKGKFDKGLLWLFLIVPLVFLCTYLIEKNYFFHLY